MAERQRYQWGTRVTREYLEYADPADESTVRVAQTVTEYQKHTGEEDARSRVSDFEHAQQMRAQGRGYRHPKHVRTVDVKLIRRPVGEWEEVAP